VHLRDKIFHWEYTLLLANKCFTSDAHCIGISLNKLTVTCQLLKIDAHFSYYILLRSLSMRRWCLSKSYNQLCWYILQEKPIHWYHRWLLLILMKHSLQTDTTCSKIELVMLSCSLSQKNTTGSQFPKISNEFLAVSTWNLVILYHRWALTPISVISDIGLSLISELPISDWREQSPTLYRISE
jgi:hypothetical protein